MTDIRRLSCAIGLAVSVLLSPFAAIAQEKIKLGLLPFSESLAAVIADPCCLWVTSDSFASVTIPVQLWASERATHLRGMLMPSAESVVESRSRVPVRVRDVRVRPFPR